MKLPLNSRGILYTLFAVILDPFVKPKFIKIYKPGRRVGNTTRMIDMFIQDFFNKGECKIFDHYDTRQSRQRVFDLVLQRLKMEHHIEKKDVSLDISKFIIRRNFKKPQRL
jgi:hypothetical protein